MGPTQTKFLEFLQEYNLETYLSSHGLGQSRLRWDGLDIITNGTCWDCMVIPRKGDIESIQGFKEALQSAPKRLKPQVQELLRVMEKLRRIVDTIDIERPWLTPNALELDSITFDEWIRRQTDSEMARAVLGVAANTQGATNTAPTWTSVLHIARQLAAAPQVDTPEKWMVVGAAGQLPALLARDIEHYGGTIKLGVPVHAIHQHSDGVTIEGGKGTQLTAKYVIVAMPPHLTGRIRYSPSMPALRDLLTQRMGMGTIVKCVAIYTTPFWRGNTNNSSTATFNNKTSDEVNIPKDKLGHSLWSNGFVLDPASAHHVSIGFDISPPLSAGNTAGVGVLATFINIDAAQPWSLTPQGRQKQVLAGLGQMFGPSAVQPIQYVEKSWADEPFIGGGYSR